MNAIASQVPHSLMLELTMSLRKSGSTLSPAQAAAAAIRGWIKAQEPGAPATAASQASVSASSNGYQWKNLFLPEGTELRMSTAGSTYLARVVGNDIVFNDRKLSPRGLTLAIAGEGRNAWRDLWIRFPGERHFLPASRCRREAEREQQAPAAVAPPANPADSLNAAALTMSEALTTMLALMERVSARTMPADDRRVTAPRREIDVLADHCAFD